MPPWELRWGSTDNVVASRMYAFPARLGGIELKVLLHQSKAWQFVEVVLIDSLGPFGVLVPNISFQAPRRIEVLKVVVHAVVDVELEVLKRAAGYTSTSPAVFFWVCEMRIIFTVAAKTIDIIKYWRSGNVLSGAGI